MSWILLSLSPSLSLGRDALDGVMVGKVEQQTFMSEFESHWEPYLFGHILHLSKTFEFRVPQVV